MRVYCLGPFYRRGPQQVYTHGRPKAAPGIREPLCHYSTTTSPLHGTASMATRLRNGGQGFGRGKNHILLGPVLSAGHTTVPSSIRARSSQRCCLVGWLVGLVRVRARGPRVVPRDVPGPVWEEGSRGVRNETRATAPRGLVKWISTLSDSDGSEIQLDMLDLPPVLAHSGLV